MAVAGRVGEIILAVVFVDPRGFEEAVGIVGLERIAVGVENPLRGRSAVEADRPVALGIHGDHGRHALARHAQLLSVGHEPLGPSVGRDRPVPDAVRILLHADHGRIGSRPAVAARLAVRSRLAVGAVPAVADRRGRVIREIDRIAVGLLLDPDHRHRLVHDLAQRADLGIHLSDLFLELFDPRLQVVDILPQLRIVVVVAAPGRQRRDKQQKRAAPGKQLAHRKFFHRRFF